MFFSKKKPEQNTTGGSVAPPWENIDKTGTKPVSLSPGFNLTDFVTMVTGFGKFGSRLFLLGLAVALGFLSYAFYMSSQQSPRLPPHVDRPAIEVKATTTITTASTTLQ